MKELLKFVLLSSFAICAELVSGTAHSADADPWRGLVSASDNAVEASGGLVREQLAYQGVDRTYFIHVPAGARGGQPLPAVFVFHGGLGDGPKMERITGMVGAADRRGFVAVFPNGGISSSEQWNDGRDTTASDKDDVGFIGALFDRLVKAGTIDPRRVFATGASNGGMFVYRLACEATGRFAAYAAVVANLPVSFAPRCAPSRPAPMMIINGTDDRLMPWAGGEIAQMRALGIGRGGTVISTPQTLTFWAKANDCEREPTVKTLPDRVDDGTSVVEYDYAACKGNSSVFLYEIKGGGHTWPGGPSPSRSRRSGVTSQELNATEVILDFFTKYGL